MTDRKLTRCPGCGTVFRITTAQLALREGQVRCGQCRAVFDANDHFVTAHDTLEPIASELPATASEPPPGAATALAEPAQLPLAEAEPSAAQLPPAEAEPSAAELPPSGAEPSAAELPAAGAEPPALQSAAEDTMAAVESTVSEPEPADALPTDTVAKEAQGEGATGAAPAPEGMDLPPASLAGSDTAATPGPAARFEWKPRKRARERPRLLYGAAMVLLVALLAAQAVLEYRDALAAHMPSTRPLLESACSLVDCSIDPLRDTAALSIDASDLQADPAHRGLLQLTATLRNRASYAIAYPYLELTLTDSSDQVVVRRAFAPADYAGGTSNPSAGIPANGERLVRLFIDASATSQAGYRLYLFYR